MKAVCKQCIQKLLGLLAQLVLRKYQPDIIGVTGSIGKTSTKEAIYTVLADKFNVRRNVKNYNNEIGLPLTILGASSGGRSVWMWVGVVMKALMLLIWRDKRFPKILILEMGVDRPGDMDYLTKLAPCRVGVITSVAPVHLEFFGSLEKIAQEKGVIVSHLDGNGWAVLNCDNELVCGLKTETRARVLTYGLKNEAADVQALEVKFSQGDLNSRDVVNIDGVTGISFKLAYQGSAVPVFLPNILGEHLVYAALAAASLGIIYGLNLLDIAQALKKFAAPKGRMNLIPGIKGTIIIDDTYNANPDSTEAALKVLSRLEGGARKVAVLGDMLELGSYTVKAHQDIGQSVFEKGIDLLITVGERAQIMAAAAEKAGLSKDKIFSFSDSTRAGLFVQDRIEAGDYVLIKGSQGVRMEKIVKEIMAEPLRAKELLVRQDEAWI